MLDVLDWILQNVVIPLLGEIAVGAISTIFFKIFVQIREDIKKPLFSVDIGAWAGYNAKCSTTENLCFTYCD